MQKVVIGRKLYHFVNKDSSNDMWEVGNDFIIDNKYNSYSNHFFRDGINLNYKNEPLYNACDRILEKTLSDEELKEVINIIKEYVYNTPVTLREYILEKIRKEEYPQLISREHCLFLTDKESLKFWKERFSEIKKALFLVEVSGILLCSHDCLLPGRCNSIKFQEYQARCYWENKLKENPYHVTNDREYLFQGKVKVLKKI